MHIPIYIYIYVCTYSARPSRAEPRQGRTSDARWARLGGTRGDERGGEGRGELDQKDIDL